MMSDVKSISRAFALLLHSQSRLKPLAQFSSRYAFTLIELLIVIAIILILISIALPNFLEAQVRAKIANARGELKSLVIATESYKIDWKMKEPKTELPGKSFPQAYSEWWGFTSHLLTTPVKYITTAPSEPFSDDYTIDFWTAMKGAVGDPPYTVIRATVVPASWPVGSVVSNNARVQGAAGGPVRITQQFNDSAKRSGYIYYSSCADRVDGTVWGNPQFYSPTNGTISFGELYEFGSGSPDQKEVME